MKTVTVSEQEFLQLQFAVAELQKALAVVQAQLYTLKNFFSEKNGQPDPPAEPPVEKLKLPLKFGAGKGIVAYMADDFNAPLEDLKEYME